MLKYENVQVAVLPWTLEKILEKWSKKYKNSINCSNPKGFSQKAHCAGKKKNENFAKSSQLDSLRKFVRSQREAPDQVLYQIMMAPDTYGHSVSDFVRSWYEKTKEENGLNDVDSALEIMVDELGLNENLAEQKAQDAIFQEILVDLLQKKYPDAEFDYQGDKVISADGKLTVIADLQVEDGYGGVWVWDVDTGPYKGVLGTAIKQATAELLRQQPDLKPALFVDGDNQNPGAWQAIANKLNYTLLDENFADGKKKGKSRPGRVKRAGASCKGSVTKLRKQAKNASGEKARMYHWCANMKSGRSKK